MSSLIFLDLSRLISRADRRTPTGIDRIELAYAEHLMARAPERLRFVAMNLVGEFMPLRMEYVRLLVTTLSAHWRDPEKNGQMGRSIGLLTQALGLIPGQELLLRGNGRSAKRPVYLLVSHKNLNREARLERFKVRSGAAFVFFVHDLIPIDYPEYVRPGHTKLHQNRIKTIRALADGIVVNSQATADSLVPLLSSVTRHIPLLVAHPGTEFVKSGKSGPIVQALSDTTVSRPYFVCVGTIEPRKNHLLLLNIWRELSKDHSCETPKLIIIGRRGWENENVVDMIDRCTAIKGLVEEHGSLPDCSLVTLIAGARALLCPAFAEGYGMPIAEALAIGVPVICSDIPAFREVGRGVPEFLDPLDGPAWLQAILDYSNVASVRRTRQMTRLPSWRAPQWEQHFDMVADLLHQVSSSEATPARSVNIKIPH